MEMLISALMAVVGVFVAYGLWLTWSDPAWIGTFVVEKLGLPQPAQLSASTLMLLAAALLVQAGLLIWALQTLRRTFREIALHDIVGVESARLMRLSGVAFLANAIAMVLATPVVSLIVSIEMPVGHRFLRIGFGTPELLAIMVSGILIVFGHLLAVASEIDDDNRQFV
jgi:hypothetical protein